MLLEPVASYRFRVRVFSHEIIDDVMNSITDMVKGISFDFNKKSIKLEIYQFLNPESLIALKTLATEYRGTGANILRTDLTNSGNSNLYSLAFKNVNCTNHLYSLDYSNSECSVHKFEFSYKDFDVEIPILTESTEPKKEVKVEFLDVNEMAEMVKNLKGKKPKIKK